jgi:hypothetical protein
MSVPTADPATRRSPDTRNPDHYGPGQQVWVYCSGSWRPGIVLASSALAATVRYRPAEGRGTAVDTVTGLNLAAREEADPYVDQLIPSQPDTASLHRRM